MKRNKISPKSAGEATISYSNFKNCRCPPPTPTPSRTLRPLFRRYALSVPPFHQQSPLHFFPLANALKARKSVSQFNQIFYMFNRYIAINNLKVLCATLLTTEHTKSDLYIGDADKITYCPCKSAYFLQAGEVQYSYIHILHFLPFWYKFLHTDAQSYTNQH